MKKLVSKIIITTLIISTTSVPVLAQSNYNTNFVDKNNDGICDNFNDYSQCKNFKNNKLNNNTCNNKNRKFPNKNNKNYNNYKCSVKK